MTTNSKKIIRILIVANLAAAAAAVFMLVLILNQDRSLTVLKKQLVEQEANLADTESLKNLVNNTKEQQAYLAGLFVNDNKITDFLSSIEALSGMSGAKVTVVSVDDNNAGKPANVVTIRFTATGSWAQVFKTISLVDHFPAALSINQLQVGKQIADNSGNGKINSAGSLWSANFEAEVLKLN